MNGKNPLRRHLVIFAGLVLALFSPSSSLLAQVSQKTRTPFIDLEAGDRTDFGRAYGTRQRDPIARRLNFLLAAQPPKDCLRMLTKCQGVTVRALPAGYNEVVALSEAIGFKADSAFLLDLLIPLWDQAALSGSTLALSPKRTVDGKTWLAVNVDSAFDQASYGSVIRRRWRGHPTTMMWSLAGGSGFAGVNSSGLAITAVWLKVDGEGIVPGVPGDLIIREALLQPDLNSVLAVLADPNSSPASSTSFAVLVADSKGKMALVERTFEAFSVHVATSDEDHLVHTNHFLDRGFARDDLGVKLFPDSLARFKTIEDAVAATPKFSVDNLQALMTSHEGKPNGICRHAVQKTIASILICPDTGTLIVTQGNPCMSSYETFKLDAPVQKWDY